MTVTARRYLLAGVVAAACVWIVIQTWAGNPVNAQSLTRLVVFALPAAGIYAISATGLVVVYTSTGIFNIAQGAMGMICAFLYWELNVNRGLPAGLAILLVAGVFAPLMGVVLDRILMRRLARAPLTTQLIATVGLLALLLGLATTIWNPNRPFPISGIGNGGGIRIEGVLLSWHRITIIGVALALALILRFLLFSTRLGVSMRAVVDDEELAAMHGVRPGRVSSLAWVIGSVCAALAGILIAPEVGNMGAETLSLLIINAFAAAVIGRLRSLPMTYVGALLVGLLAAFSQTFLNLGGRWVSIPGAVPALVLFVALLALPPAQLRLGRSIRTYHMEHVASVRSSFTAALVLVGLIALSLPFLSDVNTSRLTVGITTGLLLLGLVPLIGWAGQPFLAPFALAGFGAFFTWRFTQSMPGMLALLLAGICTAGVGVLTALPALRLRGLYLALNSIAVALVAVDVIFGLPEFFGQARQIGRPSFFGIELTDPKPFLVFTAVVYGVLSLAVTWLRRGRIGRRLVAMRDSEAATACLGISLIETKVIVFSIAGAIAGVAGGILAFNVRFIATEQFPMIGGLAIILSLTVWGIGTASGPVVAGLSAAILAAVSHDWAPGTWTRALELVGPGLAALVLVNHPRGQIPEISARSRSAPWATVVRLVGVAIGATIGITMHFPGFVGFLLAILGYISADVVYAVATERREETLLRRALAATWAGSAAPPSAQVAAAGANGNGAQSAADSDADIATFGLGLDSPMTPVEGRKLHKGLQLPEVALPGGGS
jgi:branched-chain amino acid transport system permease protein